MCINRIDLNREVSITGYKAGGLDPHFGLPIQEPCTADIMLTADEGRKLLEAIKLLPDAYQQLEDTIQGLACIEIEGVTHDLLTGWIDVKTFNLVGAWLALENGSNALALKMHRFTHELTASGASEADISWFELPAAVQSAHANDK